MFGLRVTFSFRFFWVTNLKVTDFPDHVASTSDTLMSVLLVSFWLTSGLFMMFLALLAYSRVLSVSCTHNRDSSAQLHTVKSTRAK